VSHTGEREQNEKTVAAHNPFFSLRPIFWLRPICANVTLLFSSFFKTNDEKVFWEKEGRKKSLFCLWAGNS